MKALEDKVARAERLAFFLLKAVNKAVRIYELIADGDRIAVALSGGKDSRVLAYLLRRRQEFAREQYDLRAIHVLPSEDAGLDRGARHRMCYGDHGARQRKACPQSSIALFLLRLETPQGTFQQSAGIGVQQVGFWPSCR